VQWLNYTLNWLNFRLIEKLKFEKTKFNFYQVNWLKSGVKLLEIQSFGGHLRAKFKKITTNDYFVKSAELWEQNWMKSGVNLKETKSLIINLHKSKTNDQNEVR
jgi:hypothetical protein